MQSARKIAAWQAAHAHLKKKISEDALATCGPWPSLEVSDFLVWAREHENIPSVVVQMVEQLRDELVWVYDMWAKAVVNDAQFLMTDLMVNATGADEYNFTRRFLQDYAKNHAIFYEEPKEEIPPWRVAAESGGQVPPQPVLSKEAIDAGNVEPPE